MMEDREPGIVIVGAGIGGLAAAVRLAAAGHDVTVLEAADAPGGKMRTVPSPAGPVDAGPTVLTLRHVFDEIFAVAGARLEDHVTLVPQPILARHWWPDGSTLDLHADADASAAAIRAFAGPQAEAQFRRFDRRTRAAFAAFETPMMAAARPDARAATRAALRAPGIWPMLVPRRSVAGFLRASFTDPRLRQLFGRYTTYVGGVPARTPAVLSLVWQAEAGGVWAVAGGLHRLAAALADLAAAQGARLRFGARVERITWRGGRVSGVLLEGGAPVPAHTVVFNGDPAALRAGLAGTAATEALERRAVRPRSLSAEVWSFAATPEGPRAAPPDAGGLAHHNVFFTAREADEFGPLARGRGPEAQTLYVCAEDRAAGRPEPGPERFEIILNAPPLAGPPDPQEAAACARRTFPPLARAGLTFAPEPDPATTLTGPAGFDRLFPGSGGAIYGRSPHGMMAAFLRPGARTALPGLYLAGGGAHPGAGVPMAALSGRHAAEAIATDLASRSTSGRTATPGGISTPSPTGAGGRSR